MKRTNIVVFICVVLAIVGAGALFVFKNTDKFKSVSDTSSNKNSQLSVVAENLTTPWSIVFYGDTALISSRDTGEIHELNSESGKTRSIGTVAGAVHRGEGGLLGLAVDSKKRLYAYYTTGTDNRVSRFTVRGEPGNLSLGESETVIEGLPSASFHNGGRIAFGPDNMLYATVGDAGDTRSAQDLTTLSGKILRMTVDGSVPADNPYPNSFVYSYGHRNPQGLAWSEDGTMYATEFGQNTWDELNVITAGANYGWPDVEGIDEKSGYVVPVQQWATSDASPSGIAYDKGLLYIANLRGEMVRMVPTADLASSKELYKKEYGRIRDVTVSPDGEVWFVTNNTDGRGSPVEGDDRILSVGNDTQ